MGSASSARPRHGRRASIRSVLLAILSILLIAVSALTRVACELPPWLRQILPVGACAPPGQQAPRTIPELPSRNLTARPEAEHIRASMLGLDCGRELLGAQEKDYYHPGLMLLMVDCVRAGLEAEETFGVRRQPRDRAELVWNEFAKIEDHALTGWTTPPTAFTAGTRDDRAVALGDIAHLTLNEQGFTGRLAGVEMLGILDVLRRYVAVMQRRGFKDGIPAAEALKMIDLVEEMATDDICAAR